MTRASTATPSPYDEPDGRGGLRLVSRPGELARRPRAPPPRRPLRLAQRRTPSGPSGAHRSETKSPTRQLRVGHRKSGAPDKTRTCDLQVRNLTLYPTELRALEVREPSGSGSGRPSLARAAALAERVGFEPTVPFRVHALSRRVPSAARPSLRVPLASRIHGLAALQHVPIDFARLRLAARGARGAACSGGEGGIRTLDTVSRMQV